MAENSKIEWTDHTFNPWIGCTKVSPGCDNCYAAVSTPTRAMGIVWGAGQERHRTADSTWAMPKRWNDRHATFYAAHGRRQRVFCSSLADVFDNQVPPEWRVDLFRLIRDTPNLDWLLLTKRIGNARSMSQVAMGAIGCIHKPLPANVWLGATVVNQEEADRDIPKLLSVPARVRFLSMEPLLGPVDLRMGGMSMPEYAPHRPLPQIDWVIVGGESGHGARPMHPDWARSVRDQCKAAGVPFLFKQWGEWASTWHARIDPDLAKDKPYVHVTPMCRENGTNDSAPNYQLDRVGKKAAGRLLDGVTHDGFPEVARG